MPVEIISEELGLLVVYSGIVTMEDVTVGLKVTWEHPDVDRHRYQILDFRETEELLVDESDAAVTGYMDNSAFQDKKMMIAIVTTRSPFAKLCQIYLDSLDDEYTTGKIFDDMTSARQWIDT